MASSFGRMKFRFLAKAESADREITISQRRVFLGESDVQKHDALDCTALTETVFLLDLIKVFRMRHLLSLTVLPLLIGYVTPYVLCKPVEEIFPRWAKELQKVYRALRHAFQLPLLVLVLFQ